MRAITPDSLPTEVLETSYSLGQLILATRKAQGMSQESLCESADIGRSTLVQIERGSPRVQFAHWLSVLHALDLLQLIRPGVPPAELGRIARAVKRSGGL
jgi:transcriptional regulator with XRE-family HTH domain